MRKGEMSSSIQIDTIINQDEIEAAHLPFFVELTPEHNERLSRLVIDNFQWSIFLMHMEAIPFGFTVSAINGTGLCFPLVYVNKYFEDISGQDRSRLLGQSGTFLQTKRTLQLPNQQKVLKKLFKPVTRAQVYITCLTCCNSKNRLFKNVIGIKPIYLDSSNKSCRHFITIQTELGLGDSMDAKVASIEQLFAVIPHWPKI